MVFITIGRRHCGFYHNWTQTLWFLSQLDADCLWYLSQLDTDTVMCIITGRRNCGIYYNWTQTLLWYLSQLDADTIVMFITTGRRHYVWYLSQLDADTIVVFITTGRRQGYLSQLDCVNISDQCQPLSHLRNNSLPKRTRSEHSSCEYGRRCNEAKHSEQ